MQVVGFPLYTPSPWHDVHDVAACAPSSGKLVAEWLNAPVVHEAVVWQLSQVVEKPEAECGGFVVAAYFD